MEVYDKVAYIRAEKIKAGAMQIAAGLAACPGAWEEMTAEGQIAEALRRSTIIQDSQIPPKEPPTP